MKLGIIADIHGNSAALDAVLEELDRQGVDVIVNLGDLLASPMDARGTAQRLRARPMLTVRGNHDRVMGLRQDALAYPSDHFANDQITDSDRAWLAGLPETAVLNGEVFLCHGTPGSDMDYWLDQVVAGHPVLAPLAQIEAAAAGLDYPLLLCGHSHTQRVVRLSDGRLVLNPGSVGCPGYDWDIPVPHVVQAGIPDAACAVVERVRGRWISQLLHVPYDATAMVALASRHDSEGWAKVVATGWMPAR
jgi:putative phosphoesterase